MGFLKNGGIESGLALSKLVSKLECRGSILEKKTRFELPPPASIRESRTLNEQSIMNVSERIEAGLALSKLVSKLEAGSRIPDKTHESGFRQK